ncbi:MAG: hypothetical protein AB7H80_00470 [Candidatus Kapaibacterium sp.]
MSKHHTTNRTEPAQGFRPDDIFHLLERNQGRLHVLEYASFGLQHAGGKEAACLVWVISDVLEDIRVLQTTLKNLKPGSL